MEIVFWFSVLMLFHAYLIYPITIKFISLFFNSKETEEESSISVAILISVYNEEKVIKERITNIAGLDYDFSKIEVLVGSDSSTDRTNQILMELKSTYPWLSIYPFPERRGKVSVLNDLVKETKSEVILFTDANTIFEKKSLRRLVSYFKDETIGGISGRLNLIEKNPSSKGRTEEKRYWEYETVLKKLEGKCGVLIGANGGIFAIRKNLFNEIPIKYPVTDDLFISLTVLQKGFRFIYDFEAIAYEEVAPRIIDEFKRKIRFGATNFYTLLYFKDLLLNKNMLLSFAFWSHKIIRWFTPVLLLLIFVSNILLLNVNAFYDIFFLIQMVFYLTAIVGFLLKKINIQITLFLISFYFLMTNVALFIGLLKFLTGKQTAFWQSTPR